MNENMNQYKVGDVAKMTPKKREAEMAKRIRASETMRTEKAGRSATGEDERA